MNEEQFNTLINVIETNSNRIDHQTFYIVLSTLFIIIMFVAIILLLTAIGDKLERTLNVNVLNHSIKIDTTLPLKVMYEENNLTNV